MNADTCKIEAKLFDIENVIVFLVDMNFQGVPYTGWTPESKGLPQPRHFR